MQGTRTSEREKNKTAKRMREEEGHEKGKWWGGKEKPERRGKRENRKKCSKKDRVR